MTTIPAAEWQEHLDAMITGLRDTGALTDPRWIEAFRAVPRHVFTPHLRDPEGQDTDVADARQAWLRRVYRDDFLITAVTHEPGLGTDVPTSSSTRPGLMARMLELLQLREGMWVLEIGTGTGYNAGLLTHRLGACHVTSIDIDPALVEGARRGRPAQAAQPRPRTAPRRRGWSGRCPRPRPVVRPDHRHLRRPRYPPGVDHPTHCRRVHAGQPAW